ncbi:hypothetical protein WR25_17675 [Diploscapter pachys]|uniref:Poly [ADP-ribose] polymerase n=1 Tax=Diploscapter pachys TaxID=2018661 RepID=A0A2A2KBT8_9BILA|nr:hypothetical protein WR25_17675 [Diploscapter pachys]
MARTLKRARAQTVKKNDKDTKKKPTKIIDGLKVPALGKRHSNRTRVQAALHQAPNFLHPPTKSPKRAKTSKKIAAKTTAKKGKAKKTKNDKIPKQAGGGKVQKGKTSTAKKGKKGNDRLVPRDNVPNIDKNPFLYRSQPEPEYVSVVSYYRRLIRAAVRKDSKELANFFKSGKNILLENLEYEYSCGCPLTAFRAVLATKDIPFIAEYFKQRSKIDNAKKRFREPNLLQKKTSGRSNFYMLGRATRAVEMTRGGKEGNNAFLNYEASPAEIHEIRELIESGMTYSNMVAIMKTKESPFNEHNLDSEVVTVCRKGNRTLASALAEGPSRNNFNDLHRATLKAEKLPAKILPISVVKKGYMNKNITPIHTAAINPDSKMLETLRGVDPNINIPDQDNWYTIHYAAVCEGTKPLEFLLKNGATISSLTKKQENPLHCAARVGRALNITLILKEIDNLEKPADPSSVLNPLRSLVNTRTREGKTALHYAVEGGHIDAIKALLTHEKVIIDIPTSTTTNKLSSLMVACAQGNLDVVKFLIEKGALVEGKDKKKRTPLTHAIMNGQAHVAAYLLKLGAEMRKGDSSGNKPAHYAAAYGFLEELKLLAEVDPDCLADENDWKITPLFVAYMKGHHGIVRWMFNGPHSDKVDVNAKDNEGVTLLSSLLRYYDDNYSNLPNDMNFLIQNKANCGVPDGLGYNSLHVFSKMKIPLQLQGVKLPDHVDAMKIEDYKKCYHMLLSNGATLNQKTQTGETALHLALEGGNLILFEEMLSYSTPNQNIDFAKIFNEWSSEKNVLFSLFAVPCEAWKNPQSTSLSPKQYDIIAILRGKLKDYCKGNYKKWLLEKNKEGFTPGMELLKNYCQLKQNKLDGPTQTQFVNSISELLGWCIAWDSTFLTTVHEHNNRSYSLLHSSLYANIEKGANELRLLKSIIEIAINGNRLKELLLVPGLHGLPFMIHALAKNRTKALELALNESARIGCTSEIHDTILKTVRQDDGTDKVVNKTLSMLMIEKCEFDLIKLLKVSDSHWTAVDAEGNTVWHYAARSNDHRTVGLLKQLDDRKVPRKANAEEWTALHQAVDSCDRSADAVLEPIEWLVHKENVGAIDKHKRTALHYAFARLNEFKSKNLNASGTRDPIAVVSILSNAMNKQQLGNTPLAIAALHGNQAVALTLIQANSSVIEKVFPQQPKESVAQSEWIWEGARKEKVVLPDSSIPAQVVSKGQGWEAMVYVLLDTLGKNPNSLAQLTDAAIKQGQYNLANQLLKSLEAYLDGKPLQCDYDLLLTFSENLRLNSLQPESITLTVLERILGLGAKIAQNGQSKPLEAALLAGSWSLVDYFKTKLGADWQNIRPTDTYGGPIKCLITNLARSITAQGEAYLEEFMKFKNLNVNAVHDFEVPAKFAKQFEFCRIPPISWAALAGHHKLIVLLRNAGADVNAVDGEGRTPIMYAVMANDELSLNALLGDDLNITVPKAKIAKVEKKKRPMFANFLSNGMMSNLNGDAADDNAGSENGDDQSTDDGDQSDNPTDTEGDDDEDGSGTEDDTEQSENETEKDDEPDPKKIKLAYTNKKLNLNVRDKNGRNFVHYFVWPNAWENAELLNNFYKMEPTALKKCITAKDLTGCDPMELAVRNKQRSLLSTMQKIVGATNAARNREIPSDLADVSNIKCIYDVEGDADKFLKRWAAERDQKRISEVPKPHKNSGYKDTGDVVLCNDTNQYMNVLLNITDLNFGRYGFHNFYRMQLIKRRDTDLWILFTNWGRIGQGEGEYQITPFSSLEAGAKEFKSIWKSKTGNEWTNLANFQEKPGKYKLFQVNTMPYNLADIELPIEKIDEKAPILEKMLHDISNPKSLKDYAKQMSSNLRITCPFGRITLEAINKAKKILDECVKTIERLETTLNRTHTDSDVLNIHKNMNDLTSQFYSLIPSGEYEYTNLARFTDIDTVKEARRTLNRLEEIEVATRILSAAEENRGKINRITYITNALECKFETMNPKSDMAQRILEFVHNTGGSGVTVKGIIAISPKDATLKFSKYASDTNQMFLWHGTKAMNLLSILKDGYLLDPLNATRCGRLFGDGTYFSDAFEKSSHYCQASKDGVNYMLLNQVAIGKLRKLNFLNNYNFDEGVEKKAKEDTLQVVGVKYPSYMITVDGVRMPLGPLRDNQVSGWGWKPDFSEFIVRSTDRILPRFIVIYK